MNKPLQQTASRLSPSVLRLAALLTPLAHGGHDSHGAPIGSQRVLAERMLGTLRETELALALAKAEVMVVLAEPETEQ